MTDEQVTKALECCMKGECSKCPFAAMVCSDEVVMQYALDLIKRQQAEIEELTERLQEYKSFPCFTNDTQVVTVSKKADGQYCADRVTTIQIDKIRSEAYKEFAEKLKSSFGYGWLIGSAVKTRIDNLVKELTEGSNDERRMD